LLGLKKHCEKILADMVDDDNCLEILKLADTFNFPLLKKYVMERVARDYTKIFPTPKYREFLSAAPKIVVELQRFMWDSLASRNAG